MKVFQYQRLAEPAYVVAVPFINTTVNMSWQPNNPEPVKPKKDFARVIRSHSTGFGIFSATAPSAENPAMWYVESPNPVKLKRVMPEQNPVYHGQGVSFPAPASAENPAMWHTNEYLPVRARDGRQAYLAPFLAFVMPPDTLPQAPETTARPKVVIPLTYPDVPRNSVSYPGTVRIQVSYPGTVRIVLRGSNP